MKRIWCILGMLIILSGCTAGEVTGSMTNSGTITGVQIYKTLAAESTVIPDVEPDLVQNFLDSLTIEQRVGQLFLVACPNEAVLETIAAYQFGGFIFFGDDIDGENPDSLREFINMCQQNVTIPMLMAVDEEGGTVCRISSHKAFRESRFPSPGSLLVQGGLELLLETEYEKCMLLESVGLNVNLAPVCDVTTQTDAFMYDRSLRISPAETGYVIQSVVTQMNQLHIGSVLKHFPGYGNNTDTHVAMARDERSLEELEQADLLPFAAGMEANAGAVMVSHTVVTAMDETMPASLSSAVHRYIRENMCYDGVIMTDDLAMAAISQQFGSGEAAVLAVLAGNDMLCTWEYETEYAAVLEAVYAGRIPEEQLNTSVLRILRWKQSLGLLNL